MIPFSYSFQIAKPSRTISFLVITSKFSFKHYLFKLSMDLLLVKCAAVLWNYYLSASAFFLNVDLGWGPMGQAMAEGLVRALQKSG